MSDKTPLISIIVPIYNSEKTLRKCLESIINQTYKNLEILLIIRNSTFDNSLSISQEFAGSDRRISIHGIEEGLPYAVKAGIEAAAGDYIGFVDSDDYIEKDMFEKMLAAVLEKDADFVQCGVLQETAQGIGIGTFCDAARETFCKEEIKHTLLRHLLNNFEYKYTLISNWRWNKLFKKSTALLSVKKLDMLTIGEDLNLIFAVLLNSNRAVFIKDVFYHYVKGSDTMTARYMPTMNEDYERLIRSFRETCEQEEYRFLSPIVDKREYAYKLSRIRNICRSDLRLDSKKQEIKNIHKSMTKVRVRQLGFKQRLQQRIIEALLFFRCYSIIARLLNRHYKNKKAG